MSWLEGGEQVRDDLSIRAKLYAASRAGEAEMTITVAVMKSRNRGGVSSGARARSVRVRIRYSARQRGDSTNVQPWSLSATTSLIPPVCDAFSQLGLLFTLGWTIFDRLYLRNGTLYVVTDEPDTIPNLLYIISSGAFITSDPKDIPSRAPTDQNMRVISTAEARQLFGAEADRLDGVSVS